MTVIEVLAKADLYRPNTFTQEEKLRFIKDTDRKVWSQIMELYEDGAHTALPAYETMDETLMIEPPYDTLYLYDLEAQMAYWSGDTEGYNRAVTLYNALYAAFENHYHKKHKPIGNVRFVF